LSTTWFEMNQLLLQNSPTTLQYLRRAGIAGPWRVAGPVGGRCAGAVVIPALAERDTIEQTLHSLAANPPELLAQFLVLVVVNHTTEASNAEKADNQATLASLPIWRLKYGIDHLQWVDAASPGRELPARQGVGLARKIGLDLALPHLDYTASDPLLVCLDADTLVQPDYLAAVTRHFADVTCGGASIPYCHRPAGDPAGQTAIDRYELFLRVYVLGLELAGSPYAFHTVGSAMACRVSAYVAAGGMNRRLAGEDFYFLQQVHKTAGVAQMTGTVVHPSPRASHRVPFGTGRAVGEMLKAGDGRLLFYQPELFALLGNWLRMVTRAGESCGTDLLDAAGDISPHVQTFLTTAGFAATWDNLKRHNPGAERRLAAFHSWFDAFRTMRLLHHLTDAAYPRIPPEQAVAPLMALAGHVCPPVIADQLALLRRLQGAGDITRQQSA
jgi:glycosyltransferase involved in cell wall biosynthesis